MMNDYNLKLKETKFSIPKKTQIQLEKIEEDIKKHEKELERIGLAPTHTKKYLLKRANYLYYVGNYDGACEIFDRILQIDPENINAKICKDKISKVRASVMPDVPAALPSDNYVCNSCGYIFPDVPIAEESICLCGIRYVDVDLRNSNEKGERR